MKNVSDDEISVNSADFAVSGSDMSLSLSLIHIYYRPGNNNNNHNNNPGYRPQVNYMRGQRQRSPRRNYKFISTKLYLAKINFFQRGSIM